MAAKDPVFRHEVHHNLLFGEALAFGHYISIKLVKDESLHPSWLAFQHSIESIKAMLAVPDSMATVAVDYLIPLSQALTNLTGKIVLTDDENSQHLGAIAPEFDRIHRGFFSGTQRSHRAFRAGLVQRAYHELSESMLTRGGLYALMEAQIIGVWTAFNTLTTELAVAAITEWPKCLNHYKKQKIDLGDLLEAGDDQEWKGRIGDLARLFIGFDSFAKTVEAYERLFDESVSDVIKRKPLKMASVVRNQCIHEACIVTKKFLGDAKLVGIEPWQSATVGELLPINGRAIAELCEEVIQGANDLILALDSWLGKLPRLAKIPPLPAE